MMVLPSGRLIMHSRRLITGYSASASSERLPPLVFSAARRARVSERLSTMIPSVLFLRIGIMTGSGLSVLRGGGAGRA